MNTGPAGDQPTLKAASMLGVEAPRPVISLVIPAYNEGRGIGDSLRQAHEYLTATFQSFELILVDDGSSDDTAAIARAFAETHRGVRAISIVHAGKAAAVRTGMELATGDYVAFTDADLATPLTYLEAFVRAAENGADVVIGSREGAGSRRIGEPLYRHIMGRVFNMLVKLVVLPGIEDTQCGFKLFSRLALRSVLDRARLYRDSKSLSGPRVTAFDVELLVIARALGLTVLVRPVVWTYGTRSKVNPVRDTINNGLDIAKVRFHLWKGHYS